MMNKRISIIAAAGAIVLLAACNVKDPIFDTAHPAHGTVTLTTDWSGIGTGLTAPGSYTVSAALKGSAATSPDAEYSTTLTGITNRLDHLFAPGTYRFLVHNTAEHVSVSGAMATVGEAPSRADVPSMADAPSIADAPSTGDTPSTGDAPGHFVQSAPGWLFSSVADLAITQDTEHTLTATMQQQVRQLTLIVDPTGGTTHRIKSIEGYLTGVASTLNMADGTHSEPASVALSFSPVARGGGDAAADANAAADAADAAAADGNAAAGEAAQQWTAKVHLLGIAGPAQKLVLRVLFADDSPKPLDANYDLSQKLAAFNTDKRTPLTLSGNLVETPTEAGFGATITDWTVVENDPVVAD